MQATANLTKIDPYSKINNPKARKLIENLEKQRKPDSTGGSSSADYNHTTGDPSPANAITTTATAIVPNARNITQVS